MRLSKIALIVMIVVSIVVVIFRYINVKSDNIQNTEYLSALYAERVSAVIAEAANVTEVLDALLVASKGELSSGDITTMMSLAYNEESHIAIAYMPNGIITKAFPLKGNEASIGYNVFEDPAAKNDATRAMETRKIVYSGPYQLMIGIPGLVARNPVYYFKDGKEVFWGFIAAIIRPSDVLLIKAGLKSLEDLNYEYSVQSDYNNTHVDLYTTKGYSEEEANIFHEFQVGQGNWQISIYEKDSKKNARNEAIFIIFAMATFTSLIYIALRQSELRQSLAHTQSLTDALTNLYNKRALIKFEERRNKRKIDDSYTIFYIDLNKFKPVNDEHGHEIGDRVLALFAERLMTQFRKDTFISRVGGDEFVIIFPSEQDELQCLHVKERLLRLSEDPFFIENLKIHISCSIGYASYPTNGDNFADVLAQADKRMFAYKKEHRKPDQ